MKTIDKFAAQQLSKPQMNNLKGGKSWACYSDGEFAGFIQTETKEQAEAATSYYYGGDVDCHEY
jgi:hypothetical protein